ncbi:MAG: M28 family peptidase [Firmicutes bacterium]|nr:M28 family peptidase [Bacillota bacterium]
MDFYERLKSEISLDNIYRDMTYLVEEVGERLSGTAEMKKATEYIRSRLEENGVEARIDHFPMYQSYPKDAHLVLLSPEERKIEARPVCHIDSTPEGGIDGELIYLGSGRYEDYEGIDVKDKIVLTNMNWSPGRPEKARIAWEMGAKALIIMNWGESDSDLIQMGAVKAQWGNPTPETVKDIVRLTVISVSRKDGEYARIFAKYKDELDGSLVFAFWDGHEIAEGGGSTWYADNYWGDMTQRCVGYVNIDNLAIKGTTIPGVEGQPELKEMLMEAIKTVFGEEGVWHRAYKGGGDSSFFGIGVPYSSFATEYTEEKLEELNYAFYSPWLHTDDDTVDKIDKELMKKHVEYFICITEKLLNSPVFPYDFEALADDVQQQWNQIMDVAGRAKEMLETVTPKIGQYAAALKDFYKSGENLSGTQRKLYDKAAVICERHTAMFRCYSGRYGQDSCCAVATENPIPALKKTLDKYNKAELGSEEFYLWETMVLRVRNMVFDAVCVPLDVLQLTSAAMDR